MESTPWGHDWQCLSRRQLSDDQLLVIHDLLLKSPPGELYIVLDGSNFRSDGSWIEIRALLPGCAIPQEFLENAIKEYNLANHVLVDAKDSSTHLVLVGSNDDASNVYYDVLNQRMYTFDHLDNAVVSEEEFQDGAVLEEDMKQLRDSLIQKSRMYIKERFSKRSGA